MSNQDPSASRFISTEDAEETLSKLYIQVDTFIQRLIVDKDWEITADAHTIQIKHPFTKERGTLSDLLGTAISDYQDKQREASLALIHAKDEVERNLRTREGSKSAPHSPEVEKAADAMITLLALTEKVFPKALEQQNAARNCQALINMAFANGVVIEGPSTARKLKECQESKDQLARDNQKLSEAYEQVRHAYEQYRNRVKLPRDEEGGASNV